MAQTKAQLLGPVVGDVTIDTNTLSLDSESNKVGIGTASATTKLHVKDTFNTAYSLTNVADEANHILKLENASTTANAFSGMQFRVGSGADLFFGAIQQTVNHGDFFFANQNSPQKEMMRIKSTGLVGIGTDNPAALLHLESTAANAAKLRIGFDSPRYYDIFRGSTTNSGYLNFYGSQSTFVGYIFDGVDGEWMRIKSNGKVGIGEDTPIGQLDIKGNVSSTTQFSGFDGLRIHNANGSAFGVTADMYFTAGTASSNRGAAIGSELVSGYGNDLYFATNGGNVSSANTLSERLRITSDGKIGIGVATPSQILELKTGEPRLCLNGTSANSDKGIEFEHSGLRMAHIFHNPTSGEMSISVGENTGGAHYLTFKAGNGTEKLRITSTGDMGLGNSGCSNPGADPAVGNSATVFEIRQTTGTNLAGGNNRRGAVLRLKHEAQWENGYQNSATDDLGRVEFVTGDASTGEGVRSIIRCRNLQYYNDQALTFEVAEANSSTIVERLRISSDGDIGISESAPTRKLSINGSMNLASGSRIESYSSGGNLIIQGGSTYPGGHIKMYGGTANPGDKIEFCTSGQSASSTVRATLYDSGTLLLHDGTPSQLVNSNTKLEVRGPAIGNAGVDVDYFKGFKLSLDDSTEWGGQVQHAVGRYEESGSSARTSYMISLGHGSLNSQSNADVNVMEMRSNGCVMTPGQPAFQATGFGSYRYMNTWQDVALSTWNFLDVNTGSHFNNSNGRFTAPVSGKYFFIYTTMFSNPSTNDFALKLHKNGSMIVISNNHSGGGSSNGHTWNDATVQAIINLVPGDYVDVRASGSNSSTCFLYGSTNSRYGTFSGFLIG